MEDIPKNVMEAYFDAKVNQESRVCDSFVRKVIIDEKGNEHISFVPFDSVEYQKSLGDVSLWSLDALLKAGINPDFGIHTGFGVRLEAEQAVNSAIAKINDVVESESKN